MTANEEFDLPRWQTHHTQSSIGHQDPAYSAYNTGGGNSQQQPLGPPPQQRNTAGPRITQMHGTQDQQMGSNYNGVVGRSNSLQASSSSRRRQHHTSDDLEVGGGPYSSPSQQQSLYPHSVAYAQQHPSREDVNVPADGAMAYLTAHGTPKRQVDTPGSSPLRSNTLLDPYSSSQQQQHVPYSPASATSPPGSYPYSPNDPRAQPYQQQQQQQQSRSRTHSTNVKVEPNDTPMSLTASAYPLPHSAPGSASAYSSNQYAMEISTSSSPMTHTSPAQQQQQQHLAFASSGTRQHSTPGTPLSFAPNNQPAYYQHDTPMAVEPPQPLPQKRRPTGFRRVREARDLRPMVNTQPSGRRVGADGMYLSVSFFFGHRGLRYSHAFFLLRSQSNN